MQMIIVIVYFVLIKRKELFKIEKTKINFYVIAFISASLFIFFQYFLYIFYYLEFSSDLLPSGIDLKKLMSFNVFTSILIVPITEELFFRNYIQRGLQTKFDYKKAIIITSILFASIHLPFISLFFESLSFSLHQTYIAFFGGLISGILFYKSKSIGPSIVFHIIWNLIANISI